jgi:hypothetical protein
MKMSGIDAMKGSLQFALQITEMDGERERSGVAAELMSEIDPLVRFIFW